MKSLNLCPKSLNLTEEVFNISVFEEDNNLCRAYQVLLVGFIFHIRYFVKIIDEYYRLYNIELAIWNAIIGTDNLLIIGNREDEISCLFQSLRAN